MENEINSENYPIKKSYYLCSKIVNVLWLPAVAFMIITGENIFYPSIRHTPDGRIDWMIIGLLLVYMMFLFFYYWNDKIKFNIDASRISIKSKKYERSFPMNCITGVEVPIDFWHRTLFELIGNYYRLKITVDRNKLYASDHAIVGRLRNSSNIISLSGLSKNDAQEIDQQIKLYNQ